MTHQHECKCPHCKPEAFPSGPRLNQGHVGLRFAVGQARVIRAKEMAHKVFLDGQELPRCFEACAGEAGFAIVYADHRCNRCGISLCAEILTGAVHIEATEPQKPPTMAEMNERANRILESLERLGWITSWRLSNGALLPFAHTPENHPKPHTPEEASLDLSLLFVRCWLEQLHREAKTGGTNP